MNLDLANPYSSVSIPRARLSVAGDSTVIVNPMALDSAYNGTNNPYGAQDNADENKDGVSEPPPYTVKEDAEEVGRCRACCYRCRKK